MNLPGHPRALVAQRIALPAALLLALQFGVFVRFAGAGLDFSDESFYVLSYAHWRHFAATSTFFAALIEPAFRLCGEDLAAVRIFGAGLLLASGALFGMQVLGFAGGRLGEPVHRWVGAVAGMVASAWYFAEVGTLRAPSYNTVVLFGMQVATAMLLVLLDAEAGARRTLAAGVYGVSLAACAMAKAPSALLTALLHLALAFGVPWRVAGGRARLVLAAAAGAAAVLAGLTAAQPDWPGMLRLGVELASLQDSRVAGFSPLALLHSMFDGSLRATLAAAALVLVAALPAAWWRTRPGIFGVVLLGVCGALLLAARYGPVAGAWWSLLTCATVLPDGVRLAGRQPAPDAAERSVRRLQWLLILLPLAYSFGTNVPLREHTRMAAGFVVVALLLSVLRLRKAGLMPAAGLGALLFVAMLPPLLAQWRTLHDVSATYRLRAGLAEQTQPMAVGVRARLLAVDTQTRSGVEALRAALLAQGFRPGDPVIDVTGELPGLVLSVGGVPPGSGWLVGGYPGSSAVTARIWARTPPDVLRRAWIISADDGRRAIVGWPAMLAACLPDATPTRVGQVTLWPATGRDADGQAARVVSLWRLQSTATADEHP